LVATITSGDVDPPFAAFSKKCLSFQTANMPHTEKKLLKIVIEKNSEIGTLREE